MLSSHLSEKRGDACAGEEELRAVALPSYTAERYWLISEIDQCARIVALEDDDPKVFEGFEGEGELHVYLLWRLGDPAQDEVCFNDKLQALLKERRAGGRLSKPRRWSLTIEALLPYTSSVTVAGPKKGLDRESRERIEGVHRRVIGETLADKPSFTVFGVCDQLGGAPALERLLDALKGHKNGIVVLFSRLDLLGHDAAREPDACSGFQMLYESGSLPPLASAPHGCSSKAITGIQIDPEMMELQRALALLVGLIACACWVVLREN